MRVVFLSVLLGVVSLFLIFGFVYKSLNEPLVSIVTKPPSINCPKGYQSYENNSFSLCFSNYLTATADEKVLDPQNGSFQRDAINLSINNDRVFSIIPKFSPSLSKSRCFEVKNETFQNFEVIVTTLKIAYKKTCEDVVQIGSFIKQKEGNHFAIIYTRSASYNQETALKDLEVIKSTLEIKKP